MNFLAQDKYQSQIKPRDPGVLAFSFSRVQSLGQSFLHGFTQSESESRCVLSDSFRPHQLYSPGNSPGQNTRVGSLSLLQGIFPTQGVNPVLLHCRWILYQLSHKGSRGST